MGQKVQFMALVDDDTRDRLDALRIVMRESRARIMETALLNGGIKALERGQHPRLVRLYAVAEREGKTWQEYVRGFALSYSRQYGPSLEDLEARQERFAKAATPEA